MPQLHFYVPEEVAKQVKRKAEQAKVPVSRYLADIVKREAGVEGGWPEGYFEQVFGQWEGKPLQRPSQGEFEKRLEFE